MPEEQLIVSVSETGALTVKRNIEAVGESAKSAGGMLKLLQNALGAIAVGAVMRQYVQLADTFTRIQNTLRKFADNETYLTSTTAKLYQVSQQTRSGFEATTETFEKVRDATAEWGMTQQDALVITKSLNQAIVLSGGSADQARAAIFSFTKSLMQGSISGLELRTILKDMPVVADILAKELKVTTGQLRKMGEEGKISADVILKAFQHAGKELDEKFAKRLPTVGQAMTVLRNSFIEMVGAMDKSTGASGRFAQAIIVLSQHLPGIVSALKALVVTFLILFSPQILNGALALGTNLAASFAKIIASAGAMSATALPTAIAQVGKLTAAFKKLWLVLMANPLIAVGALLVGGTVAALDYANKKMTEAEQIQEAAHQRALSMIQAKRKEVVARRESTDAVKEFITALKQENEVLRLNEAQQGIQRALIKATAEAKRPLTEAEILSITNLVKENQAIVRSNEALSQRADYLKELLAPETEYAAKLKMLNDFSAKGELDTKQYAKALWDLKETYGKLGKEKPIDLVSSPQVKAIKQKIAVGNVTTDMGRENNLLRMGNQEREVQIALTNALNAVRQATGNASAQLTKTQEAEVTALVLENQELQIQAQLYEEIKGPIDEFKLKEAELIKMRDNHTISLQEFDNKLKELKSSLLGITEESGLEDAIDGALFDNASAALDDFVAGGKVKFSDFAASIIRDIFAITQRLILMQAFKGLGFNIPGAQHGADFQVGGSGGPDSQLVAFRATPGERVIAIPPGASGAPAAAPAMAPQPVRIVNQLDPGIMLDAMGSTRGERVIMNVIRRNPTSIRRLLGG